MPGRIEWRALGAIFLLALALPACKRPLSKGTQQMGGNRHPLEELAEVYAFRAAEGYRLVSRVQDLEEHEPAMPNAFARIQTGDLIVCWGTGLSNDPQSVIAYEKACPTSGGMVLIADGKTRQVSAAEFQALRKSP